MEDRTRVIDKAIKFYSECPTGQYDDGWLCASGKVFEYSGIGDS